MKTIYQAVAVLAIAQLLALAGFAGTLAARGAFSRDRLAAASAALRGDIPAASQPASQPATQPAQTSPPAGQLPRGAAGEQIRTTELDRREREIQDQWALLQSARLTFLREREQFEQSRKEWATALKRQAEERDLSGAQKELEYISSVKAALAKDILRQKKEPDAVQLLLQMETRTGRKIIESCKTPEERLWIGRVLEQLRQRNDSQAEALTAGEPRSESAEASTPEP